MKWIVKHFSELSREELYEAIRLRLAVFSIEQNCPYQDADGKDQRSFHLWMEDEKKEMLAYSRIVEPGVSYKEVSIGRVVTAQAVRGSGAGRELMKRSIGFIEKKYGMVPIRISAQCYLKKFYKEFNFEVIGEEYIEDHIPHVEMLRK
jgi:ElaA protein